MKKVFTALIAAAVVGLATMSSAATVNPSASGEIAATGSKGMIKSRFAKFVDSLDMYEAGFQIYKVGRLSSAGHADNGVSGTFDGSGTSGSWSWSGADAINFVVYKAPSKLIAQYFAPGIFGNDFDATSIGLVDANGDPLEVRHVFLLGIDGVLKPSFTASFALSAVPLPAGGLLLVSGLGLMALRRRR